MIKLRPYQEDIIAEARDLMVEGSRSVLLQSPTGSGKTVLTADMLQTAAAKGKRCWFLVHRRELIKQSVRTFVDVKVPHGVIANNFIENPDELVQIASVQSLARRYHKVQPPDLIIYDEAHHVSAGTWDRIYKAFPNAYHIGLTATPERLDGKALRPWFQSMILGPKVRWLIDNGYLCDYKIFAPTSIDTSDVKISGGDFNKKALREAVASKPQIVGDAVREYKKFALGRRMLAFNVSVQASKDLVNEFKAEKITAVHVDGETDRHLRDLEIKRFKDGDNDILSNVDLFGEGFDVPAIEGIFLLRPTDSLGLYLQQVGRVLRPIYAPGYDLNTADGRLMAIQMSHKPYALILDHAGNVMRHGLPDEDRSWSLDGKKGRRKMDRDGPGVKICPACYAAQVTGPPKCVHCGYVFDVIARTVERVDGELHEMDLNNFKILERQQKVERKEEQSKAQTLEELKVIGKARGYKPGWAAHVYQSRLKRDRYKEF